MRPARLTFFVSVAGLALSLQLARKQRTIIHNNPQEKRKLTTASSMHGIGSIHPLSTWHRLEHATQTLDHAGSRLQLFDETAQAPGNAADGQDQNSTNNNTTSIEQWPRKKLSSGVIIAIAVGTCCLVAISVAVIFLLRRRAAYQRFYPGGTLSSRSDNVQLQDYISGPLAPSADADDFEVRRSRRKRGEAPHKAGSGPAKYAANSLELDIASEHQYLSREPDELLPGDAAKQHSSEVALRQGNV
jgi:hypothetical protein